MRAIGLAFAVCLVSAPAYAHHEALFGPQSAAVLSPTIFLAGQVFDKETGTGPNQRREFAAPVILPGLGKKASRNGKRGSIA